MPILSILVMFVIILLVFWACRALLAAFKVEDPIATLVYVLLVVFVILWLLSLIGGGVGFGHLQWR